MLLKTWGLFDHVCLPMPCLNVMSYFSTETCVEFDGMGRYFNWTQHENVTSPVREFWEWVCLRNQKNRTISSHMTLVNCNITCDLQEKDFESHWKCRRIRQHAMGAGSVSYARLDRLLLLRLERSEVHWEGTRTFDVATLDLFKGNCDHFTFTMFPPVFKNVAVISLNYNTERLCRLNYRFLISKDSRKSSPE